MARISRSGVSPERLQRFFAREEQGYRVQKGIREMIVFAPQNMIMDPPFTRIDLISCRNVLIYFTADLQKKLLPLFHHALAPEGILFLGSSETIGEFRTLFSPIDAKSKIFRRRELPAALAARLGRSAAASWVRREDKRREQAPRIDRPLPELSRDVLLQHFAPPAVLVNETGEILYIHGKTGQFLEPASGEASLNLFAMAREGLRMELGALIRKALLRKQEAAAKGLRVRMNGGEGLVNLRAHPVTGQTGSKGLVLVTFEAIAESTARPEKSMKGRTRPETTVSGLEQELVTSPGAAPRHG